MRGVLPLEQKDQNWKESWVSETLNQKLFGFVKFSFITAEPQEEGRVGDGAALHQWRETWR